MPVPLALQAVLMHQPAMAQIASAAGGVLPASGERAVAAEGDPQVRVLLQQGPQLVVEAQAQPLRLSGADGRQLAELAPGGRLQLESVGQGIRWRSGAPSANSPSVAGVLAGTLWLAVVPAAVQPGPEDGEAAAFGLMLGPQLRRYRGGLEVRLHDGLLQAINRVGLEPYLASVVGSEMPSSWPQPALRAQSVAARTYALRKRNPAAAYDLQATVSSQVYRGLEGETTSTREAVASTRGQVLTHAGSLIEAVFHSSSGGSTEASGQLWNQQLPYLVSVPDFDDASPVRSWQERFGPDQLRQAFPESGGLTRLRILERTSSGRVRQVRIEGPRGMVLLSGAQLRSRLGLRSTLLQLELLGEELSRPPLLALPPLEALEPLNPSPLNPSLNPALNPSLNPALNPESSEPRVAAASPQRAVTLLVHGRGYGHGIGMSQWGAYGMALRGLDYGAILSHYYPGAALGPYAGR